MRLVAILLILATAAFIMVVAGVSFADDLYTCYERAADQIKSDKIAATSQYWSEKTVCQIGREVYDEYGYCMRGELGVWGFAQGWFEVAVTAIEPVANQVVEEFRKHNVMCYAYPDYVIEL